MSEGIKRALDVALALCGLVILWPVLVVCAFAIRFTSEGPVIYRGLRTGRHGRPFSIYKFRSMHPRAEQLGGTTTAAHDPRITPVGAVLRKYKLDELPQLFNVLKGDMSFVGPRPEVAEYTDAYTEQEQFILTVRPGITDLSSLEFHDLQEVVGDRDADAVFRSRVLPRKNALRLKYARERTLLLDCFILVSTIGVVCFKPFRRRQQHHARPRHAA